MREKQRREMLRLLNAEGTASGPVRELDRKAERILDSLLYTADACNILQPVTDVDYAVRMYRMVNLAFRLSEMDTDDATDILKKLAV